MQGRLASLMASLTSLRREIQRRDDAAHRVRSASLPGAHAAVAVATFVLASLWLGLIAYAWATQPTAIGTFMFQFLHATAFTLLVGDLASEVRAGATLFFLATDATALALRCAAPVVQPAWGAFHVLSVVHSALLLALALAQAAIFWAPYAFARRRPAVA